MSSHDIRLKTITIENGPLVIKGGDISITNSTNSTSTSNGALIVSGGVGIASSVNIGGITKITNTTNSTSTSTGSFQVSGGIGIASAAFVGGVLNLVNTVDRGFNYLDSSLTSTKTLLLGRADTALNSAFIKYNHVGIGSTTNNLSLGFVTSGPTDTNYLTITGSGITTLSGITNFSNNTNSSSTSTGSLIISGSGGAGIGGNINVGGTANISGITSITNSTTSSSSSNGALVVSGGVGIGGDIFASGSINSTSDIRFKKITQTLGPCLDSICNLNPIRYIRTGQEREEIGLIAQEVAEYFPQITPRDTDGYYYLDYGRMVAVLVRSIQELKIQQDQLKKEIEYLKFKNM